MCQATSKQGSLGALFLCSSVQLSPNIQLQRPIPPKLCTMTRNTEFNDFILIFPLDYITRK